MNRFRNNPLGQMQDSVAAVSCVLGSSAGQPWLPGHEKRLESERQTISMMQAEAIRGHEPPDLAQVEQEEARQALLEVSRLHVDLLTIHALFVALETGYFFQAFALLQTTRLVEIEGTLRARQQAIAAFQAAVDRSKVFADSAASTSLEAPVRVRPAWYAQSDKLDDSKFLAGWGASKEQMRPVFDLLETADGEWEQTEATLNELHLLLAGFREALTPGAEQTAQADSPQLATAQETIAKAQLIVEAAHAFYSAVQTLSATFRQMSLGNLAELFAKIADGGQISEGQ